MAKQPLDDGISATMRGLLSLLPSNDSAAERNSSSVSLVANFRHIAPSSVLQGLQALVTMESYSHMLQRYPLVKQAFWEQVLASDLMAKGFDTRKHHMQLQDEQFPRLVLDFSRCPLTTELLETLTEFFAQSREMQPIHHPQLSGVKLDREAISYCRLVPVALKLVRCRLTADSITRLKTVLVSGLRRNDSAARFCITSLNLSENPMQSDELMALARLLDECRRQREQWGGLPLDELVLENALSRSLTITNWAAFRAFVSAAVGVDRRCKTSLKRLSLANNSLSYHHVGCICSALRCESITLEELSLACTFSLVDPADRKICWQWLAIGLRPMVFCGGRSGLRLLDLSGNPMFPMDSEAWHESLRDPQATVLQWIDDTTPQAVSCRNTTARCLLSSNTDLYSSPTEASARLVNIENEVKALSLEADNFKQWEVMASLPGKHGWLCVVVPGFGVAWTRKENAMTWEHTGQNQSVASAILSELVMNDMVASRTTTKALESFVRGFGGKLRSLELRRNALSAMELDAILVSCQQLYSLDVEGCRILQLQLLVDALRGVLGQNLRILNLNANLIGADSFNVLTSALRDQIPDRVPVLYELRVANNEIGGNGVRHLHDALEFNKRLALLELDLPEKGTEPPRRPDNDEYVQLYRTRCMRLDMSFQNELVGVTPLLLDRRLAFLLVLSAHDVTLDRGICSAIFSFAADEKRRCILWNTAHA